MQFSNVVYLIYIFTIKLSYFINIATFVQSLSIYDEIIPVNLTNPRGYVVFDLFHQSDDYYPLGLTVKTKSNWEKEFFVDDLIVFGKEIKIVFGNRCVSLTSFARNIRLLLTYSNLGYSVKIDYDLHGSKIIKKYYQSNLPLPGQLRIFEFSETPSDSLSGQTTVSDTIDLSSIPEEVEQETEGSEQQSLEGEQLEEDSHPPPEPKSLEHKDDISHDETEAQPETKTQTETKKEPETQTETETEPEDRQESRDEGMVVPARAGFSIFLKGRSVDQTPVIHFSDVTKDNLDNEEGFQKSEIVKAGNLDIRCVLFNKIGKVYENLSFKNEKFNLSEHADNFEVCYHKEKNDYFVLVSSQFRSITVEQYYKYSQSKGLVPLNDFKPFTQLKTYPERRVESDSGHINRQKFELNVDTYQPDDKSFLEKVECGKCVVYRYVDGLEDNNRIGAVTSLKFGDITLEVPQDKHFVMVSLCKPFVSSVYVTVMIRQLFLYENKIFHSVDGRKYQERKYLEDDERLELINMTSKVWHKRQSSGRMIQFSDPVDNEVEVLCLNQFTKIKLPPYKACKTLDKLENFKLVFSDRDFTSVSFKKRAPKSSVLVGNVMFDLLTDNEQEQFLYVSHPSKGPVSVLIVDGKGESTSLSEKGYGINSFLPMKDVLDKSDPRSSKKNLDFTKYDRSMYGITWDYNEYLKKDYLYPSQYPQYCLGDLMFHNLRILSHKEEGYKHISTEQRTKMDKVMVTVIMPDGKIVLEVQVDPKKRTSVNLVEPSPNEEL